MNNSSDLYGPSCECTKAQEFRNLMKAILEIKREIVNLEDELGLLNSTNEHLKMLALGDKYVPPIKNSQKCDFAIVGEMLICTHCHKQFDKIDAILPPFCPYCFAIREDE